MIHDAINEPYVIHNDVLAMIQNDALRAFFPFFWYKIKQLDTIHDTFLTRADSLQVYECP